MSLYDDFIPVSEEYGLRDPYSGINTSSTVYNSKQQTSAESNLGITKLALSSCVAEKQLANILTDNAPIRSTNLDDSKK